MVRKRCYFCDSPYQVFSCIHIELIERNGADIYIIDNYAGCQTVCARLRETGLFANVFAVEPVRDYGEVRSFRIRHALQRWHVLCAYLRLNHIVESYIAKDVEYREMWFSCHMLRMRLARLYFQRKKYPTKFYMYDEGIGSYTGQFDRKSRLNRFLEGLIAKGTPNELTFERYMYQPELDYRYALDREKIHPLHPFGEGDVAQLGVYEKVFDAQIPDLRNIQYIFFDTLREEALHTEEALEGMQRCYQILEDAVGPERMILKAHPRAQKRYPHSCGEFCSGSYPVEINYLGLNLRDTVFVTLSSTAVLSPKLLFNEEPVVIFLCKVREIGFEMSEGQYVFFQKFKASYRNPNRILMPESIAELENLLHVV